MDRKRILQYSPSPVPTPSFSASNLKPAKFSPLSILTVPNELIHNLI